MADDVLPPSVPTTTELEARIRALETELAAARGEIDRRDRAESRPAGNTRRRRSRELADDARETADRTADEVGRLFRGMTMAYAEGLRSAADAVGTFSDELSRRRDEDGDKKERDRLTKLPEDVVASYFKAVNRALSIPERTIDRFQDVYRDERDKDRDEPSEDREPTR